MKECVGDYYIERDSLKDSLTFVGENILRENSIYEVFRVIDGVPVFIEKHYDRLEKSFNLKNIKTSISLGKLKELVNELCISNNIFVGNIKLVCNTDRENYYFLYFVKHRYPKLNQYKLGVEVASFSFERKNPNAKLIKSNYRKITEKIMREKNVFELVLIDNDGYILEGSKSNIFMIRDGKLFTSPKEKVLKGITREMIYEICNELGIIIEEKRVLLEQINEFDAMFITGTSPKVLPIKSLDRVEFTLDNKILELILKEYNKKINNYIKLYK